MTLSSVSLVSLHVLRFTAQCSFFFVSVVAIRWHERRRLARFFVPDLARCATTTVMCLVYLFLPDLARCAITTVMSASKKPRTAGRAALVLSGPTLVSCSRAVRVCKVGGAPRLLGSICRDLATSVKF